MIMSYLREISAIRRYRTGWSLAAVGGECGAIQPGASNETVYRLASEIEAVKLCARCVVRTV